MKGGIAFSFLGLGATTLVRGATVVLHDFESGNYPGNNAQGNWADAGNFANGDGSGEVVEGALRLEYDNAGWFGSNVSQAVTDSQYLTFRVRGDEGGEESDFTLSVGGASDLLSNLTDDTIGTGYSTVTVDLEAVGADLENPQSVRMNFWQGESGAIEIDRIAFTDDPGAVDPEPTPTPTDTPEEPTDTPTEPGDSWEPPFPDRPPEPDTLPSEITGDTTVAELYEHFDDPYHVPRDFLDYLPSGSSSDAEKADQFGYDETAVENNIDDGSLTLDALGSQALPLVQQLADNDFPAHATVKLLPRLALIPDETEDPGTHDEPDNVWAETAGPTGATNSPGQLVQDRWPTDARDYQPDEVRVRDRIHDQPEYDDSREWGSSGDLPDSVLRNENNPVLDMVADKVDPRTGDSLGGSGFTANAPMAAEVRMHENGGGYWNQYIVLENTSEVPYFADGAVITWLGPTGEAGNLADGHWNNPHRPDSSLGHPQRDVIEVVHPEYQGLSAYAVRLAFHDEPYHMRTMYPGQQVAMEIGTPAQEGNWTSASERQDLVDTMLGSLHVELETDLDRNDALIDAIDLHYRVPN